MTDQIQSSPVGAPDSSSENALAQWQELPLFLFRKRIKSLALLRYGDTSVRLSSPAVDYILSAQYSPTRYTSDGISPAVILEETEMTYTAEPTSVPEPQRAVWEILAKSPSYEMRKTAAGRGLKVETFIELLSDRPSLYAKPCSTTLTDSKRLLQLKAAARRSLLPSKIERYAIRCVTASVTLTNRLPPSSGLYLFVP